MIVTRLILQAKDQIVVGNFSIAKAALKRSQDKSMHPGGVCFKPEEQKRGKRATYWMKLFLVDDETGLGDMSFRDEVNCIKELAKIGGNYNKYILHLVEEIEIDKMKTVCKPCTGIVTE